MASSDKHDGMLFNGCHGNRGKLGVATGEEWFCSNWNLAHDWIVEEVGPAVVVIDGDL